MKSNKVLIIITLVFLINPFIIGSQSVIAKVENKVPDYVEVGDILYMTIKNSDIPPIFLPLKNHIAMYIGNNQFIHSYYLRGVEIKDYEYFIKNFNRHLFGRVLNITSEQKNASVNWALKKVGRRYQYFPGLTYKGLDDRWYDAELVWNAYFQQGIDIDKDSLKHNKYVTVLGILEDSDTETYVVNPVPDYVKRGDIVLMDLNEYNTEWAVSGYSNDHAAIYLGHDYRDGSYFIHASCGGVRFYTYDQFHFWAENFTFYYVNKANNTQIENAISWAIDRLGLKYQYFFPPLDTPALWYRGMWELAMKCADTNDKSVKTSDRLYCTELPWAAFYNQGIDIDQNGWESVKPSPNDNYPRILRYLWDKYGWEYVYIDGDDIIESENTTLRTC
ncbi:MAG: hypothetical protein KAW45_03610 [Thermoplasmatales archaeon]|nr:hypothetical protein [Thermoplasmatales archaeon]